MKSCVLQALLSSSSFCVSLATYIANFCDLFPIGSELIIILEKFNVPRFCLYDLALLLCTFRTLALFHKKFLIWLNFLY